MRALRRGSMVTETTIHNYNASIYELITPASVLYWIRSLVATRTAATARAWVDCMAQWNRCAPPLAVCTRPTPG
jgi:hypothetical protein